MGTRADFYVGRGESAEWLGSIAFDGYPHGIEPNILHSTDEQVYRSFVQLFLESCDHATLPDQGWPWPWEDSHTTDYAYAFDGGMVHAACFGYFWFDPKEEYPDRDSDEKLCVFPDMSNRENVASGQRSGLISVRAT